MLPSYNSLKHETVHSYYIIVIIPKQKLRFK